MLKSCFDLVEMTHKPMLSAPYTAAKKLSVSFSCTGKLCTACMARIDSFTSSSPTFHSASGSKRRLKHMTFSRLKGALWPKTMKNIGKTIEKGRSSPALQPFCAFGRFFGLVANIFFKRCSVPLRTCFTLGWLNLAFPANVLWRVEPGIEINRNPPLSQPFLLANSDPKRCRAP